MSQAFPAFEVRWRPKQSLSGRHRRTEHCAASPRARPSRCGPRSVRHRSASHRTFDRKDHHPTSLDLSRVDRHARVRSCQRLCPGKSGRRETDKGVDQPVRHRVRSRGQGRLRLCPEPPQSAEDRSRSGGRSSGWTGGRSSRSGAAPIRHGGGPALGPGEMSLPGEKAAPARSTGRSITGR